MKWIISLFLLVSFKAFSHPVIYQGGWALSSSNMPSYSNNYVLYSLTHRWALGLEHWRFGKDDKREEMGFLKLNHLLYRYNGEDSQGNIYLHGGIGALKERSLYQAGIEGDWESRVLYTSLKHLEFHGGGLDRSMTQARLGISPKIAGYKELQTWFMVQGMVIRGVEDTLMITPMLRFFYHNVLWEVGSSTRGDWMLNLMVHY